MTDQEDGEETALDDAETKSREAAAERLEDRLEDRFVKAMGQLTEWVKHIVTLGSALMVLIAALLKDLLRGAQPPMSYLIAALFVLSYLFMIGAIWRCLDLIRFSMSLLLTREPELGSGDDLEKLRSRHDLSQGLFLTSLSLFAALVIAAMLGWAFQLVR